MPFITTVPPGALARFARRVALRALQITAADIDVLRTVGFGDAEIFDVAAAVRVRAFFTRVLGSPFAQLPAPLRDALTVGHAIRNGPCEAMPAD